MAGMDLDAEMPRDEVMSIIKNVVRDFDAQAYKTAEGAQFAVTASAYGKQRTKNRAAVKKVDDKYFIKLKEREEQEKKRNSLERRRLRNNQRLQQRIAEIKEESEALKK